MSHQANSTEIRTGEVGGWMHSGEVVRTLSGRMTTPFPTFNQDKNFNNRKAINLVKKCDARFIGNALNEAKYSFNNNNYK
jgi:hypothetical protein